MEAKIRKKGSGGARIKSAEKRKNRVRKTLMLDQDIDQALRLLKADEYNTVFRSVLIKEKP
jgi:hypothetical protein